MKRKLTMLLMGATLAAASGLATARDHVSFGLYVGAPAYTTYAPAPVYYNPPPVYYAPPVYYYRPAYYAPAPWSVHRHGHHHRGWDRHHRH